MVAQIGAVQPVPDLKSTEGPTTRPCRLRFVNNFQYPIDVLWLDHEGTEKKHATVQPGGQFPQGTYTTHAWRVRETGSWRLLGTYVGEEATLELTPAAACLVHKGFNSSQAFGKRKHPASWGTFQRRSKAHGIPIRAFQCVSGKAVDQAEQVVRNMLEHTPQAIMERLCQNTADVAVIGCQQATSDMPMHSFLGGQDTDYGHRPCHGGMRGTGGSWTVPTASVGEENLLMEDGACYCVLIHTLAHSVMSFMDDDDRQAVISAYFNARATLLYRPGCYMMSSADEYWAEGAQAWFEGTSRTDINDGINTRQRLKQHDAQLAALLEHAFGDNEWRYLQTAPREFPLPDKRHPGNGAEWRAKTARYSLFCWPSWATLWQVHPAGEKSGEKTP